MPRKQLLVEGFWSFYGDCGGPVAMFLSAVSCKWGWRPQQQGVRRGREAATGRPRDRVGQGVRAGREAAASSRLQDYSVRHAPRPSSVRGEWVLGVCGAGSGFSCGSQGLWSQVSRSGALSPALPRDVLADSPHIRTGKNLRISSPLVSNSKDAAASEGQ